MKTECPGIISFFHMAAAAEAVSPFELDFFIGVGKNAAVKSKVSIVLFSCQKEGIKIDFCFFVFCFTALLAAVEEIVVDK